ncbi:MAG: hypothetical protein ACRDRS_14010 [Pseudonocardiaceae bacterium]
MGLVFFLFPISFPGRLQGELQDGHLGGVGIVFGFLYALAVGGLIWFIWVAPIFAVWVGFSSTQSFRITLAWRQLKIADYVPAVKIMTFLEDARERDVLRTVGAVYQFRHATLQEQLVDQINDLAARTPQ